MRSNRAPQGVEPEWGLRAAVGGDAEVVAELRAVVMRADLERLGRYDERRVQGSAARRLYERCGFVVEAQDAIDVFMVRPPLRPGAPTAAPTAAPAAAPTAG